jgi:quercetin dioxygenase-like cupin family protein
MKINSSSEYGNFLIKILIMAPQPKVDLHEHDFHELVVIFGGEGTHYTRNQQYRIRQGDIFLIPPGIEHGYNNTKDLQLINIQFNG